MESDNSRNKYLSIIRSFWLPIVLGVGGLMFLGYGLIGFFWRGDVSDVETYNDKSEIIFEADSEVEGVSDEEKQVVVDVEGAVRRPGVYRLDEEARVEDALAAAGGMSDEADYETISKKLNLASRVIDGGKIYIPFVGESPGESVYVSDQGVQGAGSEKGGLIDINSAGETDLDTLPGVGPVTLKKIVDNRPYQSIEELKEKKVVGSKVFEDIKDKIVIR